MDRKTGATGPDMGGCGINMTKNICETCFNLHNGKTNECESCSFYRNYWESLSPEEKKSEQKAMDDHVAEWNHE